jgi:TRAP-type transport system periplasmic protein
MKIIRTFAGIVLAMAALAVASPSHAQPVTLLMGTGHSADTASSMAMEIFKAEVERRTDGAIQVEVVYDMKLGSILDIVQKVRAGAVFATWLPTTYLSRLVPEVDAINLPFVFNSYEEVLQVLDGPTGALIKAKLDAKGFTTLALMNSGGRNVMNAKRPLTAPADFKDLKLRLAPLEILHATFRAFGTTTFNTDTKDTYDALQQGLFDGMDIPYVIMNAYGFADNQKYISNTMHLMDPDILVANKRMFSSLSREHQQAIRESARIARDWERKKVHEAQETALAALKTKGLQFVPVPRETRLALRRVAAGVIHKMKGQIDAELVDRVMAETGTER